MVGLHFQDTRQGKKSIVRQISTYYSTHLHKENQLMVEWRIISLLMMNISEIIFLINMDLTMTSKLMRSSSPGGGRRSYGIVFLLFKAPSSPNIINLVKTSIGTFRQWNSQNPHQLCHQKCKSRLVFIAACQVTTKLSR